jgi:hypothetical protein
MSATGLAFWLLVGGLAFWLLGGLVARLGGLLFVLAGSVGLALNPDAGGVLMIGMGALIWLAGHWHYALRHHQYKSPLAGYVFCRWGPAWLDPSRTWAVAAGPQRCDREPAADDLTARRGGARTCSPEVETPDQGGSP